MIEKRDKYELWLKGETDTAGVWGLWENRNCKIYFSLIAQKLVLIFCFVCVFSVCKSVK